MREKREGSILDGATSPDKRRNGMAERAGGAELGRRGPRLARGQTDLFRDGAGGGARVGGGRDGTADHEIVGSSLNGFGRGADARLVVGGGGGGAHAADEDDEIRATGIANGTNFVNGGNGAIETSVFGKQGEFDGADGGRTLVSDPSHFLGIHAGKNSDAEKSWPVSLVTGGFTGGAHHGQAAGSVDGDEAELGKGDGGTNSAGDGVWNVVEFEVEEN